MGEKAYARPKLQDKTLKISNNCSKFINLSNYEKFSGRTNASGGQHAARVLETPVLEDKIRATLPNQEKNVFALSGI
jgi:hypothetical protein